MSSTALRSSEWSEAAKSNCRSVGTTGLTHTPRERARSSSPALTCFPLSASAPAACARTMTPSDVVKDSPGRRVMVVFMGPSLLKGALVDEP